MNGSLTEVEPLGVRPEFLDILLGNGLVIRIFFNSLFDYLVVDVCKVLNEFYLVSSLFKIAAKRIKNAERS